MMNIHVSIILIKWLQQICIIINEVLMRLCTILIKIWHPHSNADHCWITLLSNSVVGCRLNWQHAPLVQTLIYRYVYLSERYQNRSLALLRKNDILLTWNARRSARSSDPFMQKAMIVYLNYHNKIICCF